MNEKKSLAIFEDKEIRKIWYQNEWWFSIIDVVEALTGSSVPKRYWSDLKAKLIEEGSEAYDKIVRLKLLAEDKKLRLTDCVNTESAFRVIQSIPSRKAEPFKLWLAKVGYERVKEIENPELAQDRAREYYKIKGYPLEWIEKRMRGITIRQELTEEWDKRGVEKGKEFGILTNEITKATFGKTVGEYKKFKRLKGFNKNLRDHMTDWELILNMIGEKATTDITITKDDNGFQECKTSAKEGGIIANNTRKDIEEKIGRSLVSDKNYLYLDKKKKLVKKK